MLTSYYANGDTKTGLGNAEELQSALWIDLLNPSAEEVSAVERALNLRLPTRSQAQEIEVSSRLYEKSGVAFMTATLVAGAETLRVAAVPVTFVYQATRLVMLRFAEPTAIPNFINKFQANPSQYGTAEKVLMGLLDAIVDRLADILEEVRAELATISQIVFTGAGADGLHFTKADNRPRVDYTKILNQIGLNGERVSSVSESLMTLGRMLGFIAEINRGHTNSPLDEHWRTLSQDVASLTDHVNFLSDKVGFELQATLGRINNEQNMIIKLFSVLAVVLLPPTLVASIYGMNFENIPELTWEYGYPYALLLMLISAIVPYAFFKYKRWL